MIYNSLYLEIRKTQIDFSKLHTKFAAVEAVVKQIVQMYYSVIKRK